MVKQNVLSYIKQLGRAVFTTNEIIALSGKSTSVVTQSLTYLERQGLIFKVARGIWAEAHSRVSPYHVVPFLAPRHRVYVSFVSALHLHGIIEQIPQTVTLASTAHTRTIYTKLGTFAIHQIASGFFKGFDWYRGEGDFLIAEPEKALVDSLYLSAHKKRQFGFFPELHFTKTFSFTRARQWAQAITMPKVRLYVEKRLLELKKITS